MDILLSWSGRPSHEVAVFLREWLLEVLPGSKPWISSEDIAKGTRWSDELHAQLDKCKVCIVCVTPENVQSPWLYYEAGVIASKLGDAAVCPYLVGVPLKEITQTPLNLYQATEANKSDTLKLLRSLNQRLESPHDSGMLEGNFQTKWPQLKRLLDKILEGLMQGEPPISQRLTQEAKEMLIAACEGEGKIIHLRWLGGTEIRAGTQQFVKQDDPRSLALWKGALEELVGFGLVEDVGYRGEIFRVTREGWSAFDMLKPSGTPAPV
jgi:TIR domain